MSKNFKSVVCCVLTLLLVAGTIIFAFAGNDNRNVVEAETASEVESVVDSEITTEVVSEQESEVPDKEEPSKVTFLMGDMNNDGRITPSDARTALRIAAGIDLGTDIQRQLVDVNGDGAIKASDARYILRTAIGLDPMFPTIEL